MSDVSMIGQTEAIELPEILDGTISARIDTGARTSSIWASHLHEDEAGLHVVFFGKGSPAYDGKTHTFTERAETVVASSNGASERRYKVRLGVRIQGRRIRAWFTLADRSKQVYPVLLGRNVLRGKFVVDVSRSGRQLKYEEKRRSSALRREMKERRA